MVIPVRQFTVADLEHLPDDGNRYEVIDGELYVTSAPHFDHQSALDQLVWAFRGWHDESGLGWPISGTGIIFAANTGVIPDLMWISDERLPTVLINPQTGQRDGKLHAAPDLVVEILSPGHENELRDREVKLTLYSRRGVLEYWLVDRARRIVEVYRRTAVAALELAATLTERDALASPLLPGFALPVERIFRLPGTLVQP